ncbi:proline-rich protein 36-like [Syngnathoides biaculeatus]|uniref:proline-rich protein 36-like n=1 Tax=Syngnathoides biaculeatus TaxID=300417 RepID=UPI002ADD8784|nr:proline-rich protein 36-like [Syngnathoides biaculeatus]XP_061696368.1 proline-rich protein 36-like [Syngnathoides biaculeatus]
MGRDRTNWPIQDPAGKTRRRRDRRKVDRLPEDQASPIRVGSLTSSAPVSYAPPARYEYGPNTTRPAPHILLDSDFSEYEEDRDLYDRLPEYDSDDFDFESLCPALHPSQFVLPPRVSSTRATSPCRSKYTNLYEGTRLAIYLGPPRGGQRRRPGRALPCASRCAATKTQSTHSSPAKPADPQLVAKLPAQREEESPNHEAFHREMRAEIERQSAELAALTAQVRQGLANQPSYADVATATDSLLTQVHVAVETDPLPRHAHVSVSTDSPPTQVHVAVETDPPSCQVHAAVGTDSPPRQVHVAVETDPPPRHSHVEVLAVPSRAHAAVGTDPLPRHAHVSVSTDSPPTQVHVALETDSPPRHAHIAVSTDALQAHVAVGTDPMPPHVAVQEVATSPQPLLVRALEWQWRPARGRSTLLLCRRPARGRSPFLLCRRRARPYVPVQEVATVTLTLPSHVPVQEVATVPQPPHARVQEEVEVELVMLPPPSHVPVQEVATVPQPPHAPVQEVAMTMGSPPSHIAVQEGAVLAPPSHVAVQEGAVLAPPPSHVAVQEGAMASPPSHVAVQEGAMASPPSHVAVQEGAVLAPPPSHVPVQEVAMGSPPSHVPVQEGAKGSPPSHVPVQEELGSSVEPSWSWRDYGMVVVIALVLLSIILFAPDGSQPLNDLASLATNPWSSCNDGVGGSCPEQWPASFWFLLRRLVPHRGRPPESPHGDPGAWRPGRTPDRSTQTPRVWWPGWQPVWGSGGGVPSSGPPSAHPCLC